jgi:ATP synthase protein I
VSAIDLPHARRLAFGVVLGQAAVTAIAGLTGYGLGGRVVADSALAGGGIATVASLLMALLAFGSAAGGVRRALGTLYLGEAVKLVVVIVLFVVVLRVMRVAPLAMFAAFAATLLVYWIALLALTRGEPRRADG